MNSTFINAYMQSDFAIGCFVGNIFPVQIGSEALFTLQRWISGTRPVQVIESGIPQFPMKAQFNSLVFIDLNAAQN